MKESLSSGPEVDLLGFAEVIAENLRLLLLGPVLVGLVVVIASFAIKPVFTATVSFLPPQQQQSSAAAMIQSLGVLSGVAGAVAGIKNPSDQYVSFLRSTSVAGGVVDRFGLMSRYETKYREQAIKILVENKIQAKSGKDGILILDVDDEDPKFAAELANAFVQELGKLLDRLAVTEAQQRRLFFEAELNKSKDLLASAEKALLAVGLSESELNTNPLAAVGPVATLSAQVAAKEIQIRSMRNYLTESAPELKKAVSELSALRMQLAQGGRKVNGADGDYVTKFREFKYRETLYELMAKQYEIARVDESKEGAVIQVVDVAIPPELKSKPKRALLAILSALATFFIIFLFIFLRHAYQNARSDESVAKRLESIRDIAMRSFIRK